MLDAVYNTSVETETTNEGMKMKLAIMNTVFALCNFACGNVLVGSFCLVAAGLAMLTAKVK